MNAAGRVLIASRSDDKVREIREILSWVRGLTLLSLDDVDVPPQDAEERIEAFATFRENALAKARYFAARTGMAVLADDSGIEVDSLDGAPGVRSRRFSGRHDLAGADLDRANNQLLLDRLQGLPPDRRGARYVCAAVLLAPDRPPSTAIGTCRGRILEQPSGNGGFGYDPLFWIESVSATFAMLAPEQKHRSSHRARAFRALVSAF